MTSIYENDIDILKMYLHTINEVSTLQLLRVRARTVQTDRHTDTRDRTHYQPHLRAVASTCSNYKDYE